GARLVAVGRLRLLAGAAVAADHLRDLLPDLVPDAARTRCGEDLDLHRTVVVAHLEGRDLVGSLVHLEAQLHPGAGQGVHRAEVDEGAEISDVAAVTGPVGCPRLLRRPVLLGGVGTGLDHVVLRLRHLALGDVLLLPAEHHPRPVVDNGPKPPLDPCPVSPRSLGGSESTGWNSPSPTSWRTRWSNRTSPPSLTASRWLRLYRSMMILPRQ